MLNIRRDNKRSEDALFMHELQPLNMSISVGGDDDQHGWHTSNAWRTNSTMSPTVAILAAV